MGDISKGVANTLWPAKKIYKQKEIETKGSNKGILAYAEQWVQG
jgi:hypothetical protein